MKVVAVIGAAIAAVGLWVAITLPVDAPAAGAYMLAAMTAVVVGAGVAASAALTAWGPR